MWQKIQARRATCSWAWATPTGEPEEQARRRRHHHTFIAADLVQQQTDNDTKWAK